MLDVTERAVGWLPQLIEAFASRRGPPADVSQLTERANLLASGRSPELVQPDALAIFMDDAHTRLDDIRRQLAEPAPIPLGQELVAPFHTLRGAAAVVNAHAMSKIAGAVETGLDAQRRAGARQLAPAAHALLVEVEADLRRWLGSVGRFDAQPDPVPWLERLAGLPGMMPVGAARVDSVPTPELEDFVNVAADGIERFETALKAWREDPRDLRAPQTLAAIAHDLAQQAETRGCKSLGMGAEALKVRLGEIAVALGRPGGKALSGESFDALTTLVEHFYQFLDRYREEAADDAGPALVELAQGIPLPPLRGSDGVVTLPPLMLSGLGASEEAPPVASMALQANPPPVSAPIDFTPVPASVPETPAAEAPAPVLATPPVTPEVVTPEAVTPMAMTPAAVLGPDLDVAEADAELLEIFLAEAGELTDQVASALAAGRGAPGVTEFASLRHAFHTLKGGARMVGLQGIGEAAHRMERQDRSLGRRPGREFLDPRARPAHGPPGSGATLLSRQSGSGTTRRRRRAAGAGAAAARRGRDAWRDLAPDAGASR